MNIGKNILEQRKLKNITQEELAAELGVTAAAVSKWENGYTLPDVLMLCALADYFEVTTDELLGRYKEKHYAIVAAGSLELGEKIKLLASENGIITKSIFYSEAAAAAAVREDPEVTYLIAGLLGNEIPKFAFDWGDRAVSLYLSISNTEQGILDNLRNSLRNGD